MTARERDRLKVLHEVKKRHITQAHRLVGWTLSWVWPSVFPNVESATGCDRCAKRLELRGVW